jgi:hypothetical protein
MYICGGAPAVRCSTCLGSRHCNADSRRLRACAPPASPLCRAPAPCSLVLGRKRCQQTDGDHTHCGLRASLRAAAGARHGGGHAARRRHGADRDNRRSSFTHHALHIRYHSRCGREREHEQRCLATLDPASSRAPRVAHDPLARPHCPHGAVGARPAVLASGLRSTSRAARN